MKPISEWKLPYQFLFLGIFFPFSTVVRKKTTGISGNTRIHTDADTDTKTQTPHRVWCEKMFRYSIELCIVLFVLITLNSVYNVYGSLSGFYVDNGNDQTVMHRALTQDDAQEVEHEILELLGLPERPRRRHNIHPSLR